MMSRLDRLLGLGLIPMVRLVGWNALSPRGKGAIIGGAIGVGSGAINVGDAAGAIVGGAFGIWSGALLGEKVFEDNPRH